MRKFFTWRCIGLHLLVVVLVPAFLVAGWWQYHAALGGNDLSWAYAFEWPFFAVYAVYVWWKMIHDRTTMLDRLWAVKARAAADADGRPLHQIPGWAMDKGLAREVIRASVEAAKLHELTGAQGRALAPGEFEADGTSAHYELQMPASAPAAAADDTSCESVAIEAVVGNGPVIDAAVLEDRVVVDEQLDAYNRYLAELSWSGPEKRWAAPRRHRRQPPADLSDANGAGSLVVAPSAHSAPPSELTAGEDGGIER